MDRYTAARAAHLTASASASRWNTPRPGLVTVGTCGDGETITEQEA